MTTLASTRLIVAGMLGIPADVPPAVRKALDYRYALPNPIYVDAVAHDRKTDDLDEYLLFFERDADGTLWIPRGDTEYVHRLVEQHDLTPAYDDRTTTAPVAALQVKVTLGETQERAVGQILTRRYGTLVAPPGAGKTVMGLALVARRGQRTLWLVHTKELALQSIERARMVLGITRESGDVGLWGDGKSEIGRVLTVGLVQSLARGIPPDLMTVGHLILDEAHHAPAAQVAAVIRQIPARYLAGLTATPYRRDGLDAVINWHLGSIRARITPEELSERILTPRVIKRPTGITVWGDDWAPLVSDLVQDEERNALIVSDVADAVAAGHQCLVLTERVDHTRRLADLLTAQGIAAAALSSGVARKKRAQITADAREGRVRALVATSTLVGEGFDVPALDRLFLVTPVSWAGRVRQYVGRVARRTPGKRDAVVIDYCDDHGMLWAAWSKRRDVYKADGNPVIYRPADQSCERGGSRDRQTGKGA